MQAPEFLYDDYNEHLLIVASSTAEIVPLCDLAKAKRMRIYPTFDLLCQLAADNLETLRVHLQMHTTTFLYGPYLAS